ncbi:DUF1080 domain-containing protein [Prolixibacteraceae bacterium JC049]|nr:DUF1080 domain-containing protein [Prolixibacteraceae bacterium JC049]
MKRHYLHALIACFAFAFFACNEPVKDNELSSKEKRQGWVLLFDGQNTTGWRAFNGTKLPSGWKVENSMLMSLGKGGDIGGDIVFDKPFKNFEFSVDWKISKGGNSGIFYHVQEGAQYKAPYQTAPEYQLIDDIGFPGNLEEWQQTGADYAMHNADKSKKKLYPVGQWNRSKIVFNNGHVEHWLNGEKIVEFEAWTPEWSKLKNEGKWKNHPDYGLSKEGLIGLQDHGSYIWFKNIKIREM